MIELNEKTQQDFLNREWVQKLLNAGVDMYDAKYYLCSLTLGKLGGGENIQICLESNLPYVRDKEGNISKDADGKPYFRALEVNWCCPTYTVSELLNKLPEFIHPMISDIECTGEFKFIRAGDSYAAVYDLSESNKRKLKDMKHYDYLWFYLFAKSKNPIEALASLLIQYKQSNNDRKRK